MGRVFVPPRLALVALIAAGALAPAEPRAKGAGPWQAELPSDAQAGDASPGEPSEPPPEPSDVDEPAPRLPADGSDVPAVDADPTPHPSEDRPLEAPELPPEAPEHPGARSPEGKPEEEKPKEETWLDVGHAFIEQRVFAPVLHLDRFFSDERDLEAERARSFLRWRSEIRFDDTRDTPALTTSLRANLRFPGLNKRLERLRIVIEGQTRNTISALFPGEPGAAKEPEEEAIGQGDAGLRFRFWETLASHGDIGVGLLFRLPPGAFARTRVRFVVPVKRIVLTRYVVTGFWRTDTLFGTSAALEAERAVGHMVVARLGGGATLTERSKGVEWQSEVALLASFDPLSAAQVGATVNGATEADPQLDRWRIYTRFRRDFYRRWLFVELEPDVSWPYLPESGRRAVWGAAARLEVQFQGNERPPAPPKFAREPQDPPPEPL